MTYRVISTKSTGGGGFVFEDKVTAYFMACLLSGRPPLDSQLGTIASIDFQKKPDWLLDDILLTLNSVGKTFRCAFSVKSNQQFGKTTAPKEFVTQAWEQYLHEKSQIFNPQTDFLGLITAPLDIAIERDINWLLDIAQKQPTEYLPDFLSKTASQSRQKLFKSFACPTPLDSKYALTEENIGNLLRCIRVLSFDFENTVSEKEKDAIELCRNVLCSENYTEACDLWGDLNIMAKGYRPAGGHIDFSTLLNKLRSKFEFKGHPDFRADWKILQAKASQAIQSIPDKIGGAVTFSRPDILEAIFNSFEKNTISILLGESGCGKSVIGKRWIENNTEKQHEFLWCDANWLDNIDVEDVLGRLNHPLKDVLEVVPHKKAFFIIDGLDRLLRENSFRNLSLLLSYLNPGKGGTPWHVLFSCQMQEWPRIQDELLRFGIRTDKWKPVNISYPSYKDLKPVWAEFKDIHTLYLKGNLSSVLVRPKILDRFARNIALKRLPDTRTWAGESDLIQWFWETEVSHSGNGAACEALMLKLAQLQGDELTFEIPLDNRFTLDELTLVESLEDKHLCIIRNGKVCFEHDLYGDWARQRLIILNHEKLLEFVKPRLDSPLWQRAVRLYSLHLIEHKSDLVQWRQILNYCASDDRDQSLLKDLFLEGVIHSTDAYSALESIWEDLQKDDGVLLKLLLTRFLHVATQPNPNVMELARLMKEFSTAEASALHRIPRPLYWVSMLRFLHSHKEQVVNLASTLIGEISNKWLSMGDVFYPLKEETADMGLEVAWMALKIEIYHGLMDPLPKFSVNKDIYRAAIASSNVLPERAAKFILTACGRKEPPPPPPPPPPPVDAKPKQHIPKRKIDPALFTPIFTDDEIDIPAWQDGPQWDVDRKFRDLCMEEPTALLPLMAALPDIAMETILALIIREPGKRSLWRRHDLLRTDFEIHYEHAFFPPFYDKAPFYIFLLTNKKYGIVLILRLVNFVTDRWAEIFTEQKQEIPSIVIPFPDRENTWIGTGELYFTYRDMPQWPDIIICALMALEKWLYDAIDKGESVSEEIEFILNNTKSVAFAGLLVGVGKKQPVLFKGPLKPFLAVPEFYHWEMHQLFKGNEGFQMMGWDRWKYLDHQIKAAQKWHNLPHRKQELYSVVQFLFFQDTEIQKYITDTRSLWEGRLTEEPDALNGYLSRLVREFDINNWKVEFNPEQGEYWAYNPPQEFLEQQNQAYKELADKQLLFRFPIQCRQILDNNQSLPNEQLDNLWDILLRIEKMSVPDDIAEGIISIRDSLCGGAAVLLQLHRDWLKAHPEKEDWCIKQLVEAMQSPPSKHSFDSPDSLYNWDCIIFCAQAIPLLWAEERDLLALREMMVMLASDRHYNVIQTLFTQTARYRNKLGDDFYRLQHFILRLSAENRRLATIRSWDVDNKKAEEKRKKSIVKDINKLVHSFKKKSMSPHLPAWREVALTDKELRRSSRLKEGEFHPRDPGLDLSLIKAAHMWMPTLDKAINEEERQEWISFWKEALDHVCWMLGNDKEDIVRIEGTPYDFDRWVFNNIVHLILQLKPSENRDYFWKNILNLSSPAHYWVNDFLNDWLLYGIEENEETFVKIWQDMIDFTLSSPRWTHGTRRFYYLQELWCDLMGLGNIVSQIWDDSNKKSIVAKMTKYYEQWSRFGLFDDRSAAAFIDFLKMQAAEPIRIIALVWLDQSEATLNNKYWTDRHHQINDRLARLLDYCWQNHQQDLRKNMKAFEAFKRLLKALVEKQNKIALSLSDTVSTGT